MDTLTVGVLLLRFALREDLEALLRFLPRRPESPDEDEEDEPLEEDEELLDELSDESDTSSIIGGFAWPSPWTTPRSRSFQALLGSDALEELELEVELELELELESLSLEDIALFFFFFFRQTLLCFERAKKV